MIRVRTRLICYREEWQAGPENLERGEKWLKTIYAGNLSTTTGPFKAHKDFDFISRQITYGFYLSDHSILGPLDTELVTLAGIMIQNLPLETAWHLRGTRRVGVSVEDVELVQQCVSKLQINQTFLMTAGRDGREVRRCSITQDPPSCRYRA